MQAIRFKKSQIKKSQCFGQSAVGSFTHYVSSLIMALVWAYNPILKELPGLGSRKILLLLLIHFASITGGTQYCFDSTQFYKSKWTAINYESFS